MRMVLQETTARNRHDVPCGPEDATTPEGERALAIARATKCPKAELHLHLEGTLEPELMLALAARNGVQTRWTSADELRAAYDFADLQSFLDIYYEGMSVLITERDFYDLTYAYLRRAHADHVVHVEPFFDPQAHAARGVAFGTVASGIIEALKDGERDFGITWRLIMCFLRDQSAESAMETLEAATPFLSEIVAVGLDSTEAGNPPEKFAEVFAAARERGLRTVAHAGEEGTAADVRRTIEVLEVSRIDHGVRAMDDPLLVAELAEIGLPLTVCPLSNVKLKVYGALEDHTLRSMLEAGVLCTVNSDDPAYFGGYVNDNYVAAIEALDLSCRQVKRLLVNSFEGSFLPRYEKAAHIAEVEAGCDR